MAKRLGILVGGGPAPGLNGVIAAVTIEARRSGLEVIGFMDGYRWLVQGDEQTLRDHIRELYIRDISRIHFDGGSILRTSRTNPMKIDRGIAHTLHWLKTLNIEYMVTVGGDDTAYCANEISAACGQIKFAHVPKTIDNDLPLPDNVPTFGFQTARHLGAVLVKNLMEDSRITRRWYIVVTMGRHTGHLALGIAKSAGATLAIIPETFGMQGTISLNEVCDLLETSIIKRRAMDRAHGVLVIAEGIAERLDPDVLRQLPGVTVEYDPFGHLQLAEIELGKVIKHEIGKRFSKRGEKMQLVETNIGYVLRCADPIPIDQEYTRDLGYNAVRYLLSDRPEHRDNAMIVVDNGRLRPLPFHGIIDRESGKPVVRYVNVNSEAYRVALSYMVRLEKRDLDDRSMLERMAAIAQMKPRQFIERYQYLIRP